MMSQILREALNRALKEHPHVDPTTVESIFRSGVEAKADVDQILVCELQLERKEAA